MKILVAFDFLTCLAWLMPGLFIPGISAIVLLSSLTIGSQTLRAAFLNPVKGLREE